MMYYIKGGDVWATPRKKPGQPKGKAQKVAAAGIEMDYSKYLYYLDGGGDVARKERQVGGSKRKSKKSAAPKKAAARKARRSSSRRSPIASIKVRRPGAPCPGLRHFGQLRGPPGGGTPHLPPPRSPPLQVLQRR